MRCLRTHRWSNRRCGTSLSKQVVQNALARAAFTYLGAPGRSTRRSFLTAAGRTATGQQALYVANTLGISSFYAKSHAETNVLMQGEDSTGFASDEDQHVTQIEPAKLAETAAGKANRSANPDSVQAGQYTVILEPLAVADMLSMLAMYDLNALAHQEGRSFTTDRIGEQV